MSTSSRKMIMGAAGNVAGGSEYWISTWGGTGDEYGRSICTDSSDNIYVCGFTDSTGAGGRDFLISKYNSSGSLQWQRTLGGTDDDQVYSVTTDSSDNVYVCCTTLSTGAGLRDFLIAKYNSSGVIQWQRTLGGTGGDYGRSITTDGSGNVYALGYTNSTGAGDYDFLLAKYNSSGSIQWQRTLGGTGSDQGWSVTTDSSGNVYVCGYTFTGATDAILLAKYNSSGTIQWQRTLGGTGTERGYSVTTDSSGNVYVCGQTDYSGAGGYDFLIAKYNPSGVIQWQRTLGGTTADYSYSITTDSSDNVYVCGYTSSTGAGNYDFLIAKYNSSGNIQWQRTLGGTGDDRGYSVTTDSSDNVYVCGRTASTGAGGEDLLLAKLPSDGSLTGTYGAFTYAESTLTDAASSLTDAASSLTSSSSSLTSATASLTETKPFNLYTIS